MNGTRRVGAALALLVGLGCAGEALAQQRGQGGGRADARAKGAQEDLIQPQTEAQIAWFGRWADAAAEAKRTGRPILLMSAAPQCQQVPGIW